MRSVCLVLFSLGFAAAQTGAPSFAEQLIAADDDPARAALIAAHPERVDAALLTILNDRATEIHRPPRFPRRTRPRFVRVPRRGATGE